MHRSHKAYLGDITHIRPSTTDTINNHLQFQPNNTQSRQSIKQSNFLQQQYTNLIKSQIQYLYHLCQQLGIKQKTQQILRLQKRGNQLIDYVNIRSKNMIESIVQRWRIVMQQRYNQQKNLQEVVLFKQSQSNNKLNQILKQNKQLIESNQLISTYLKQSQQNVLKLREENKSMKKELQNTLNQFITYRDQKQLQLLSKNQNVNKQSKLQSNIVIPNNLLLEQKKHYQELLQHQKQQIKSLANMISLQKEEINQLIFSYQKQLKESAERISQKSRQNESLKKENMDLGKEVEGFRKGRIEYEAEREVAMKSLNSITLRVKEYERQHSQEKMIDQKEILKGKMEFKSLEEKYLAIIMRSAKWNMVQQVVECKIENKSGENKQAQFQRILKQFQMKSQIRFNEICKNNEELRQDNQSLHVIRQDLMKKLALEKEKNKQVCVDRKMVTISELTEQQNYRVQTMTNGEKQQVLLTIGTKIQTLRQIMKSLQSNLISESSIEQRCVNKSQESRLKNLFETRVTKQHQHIKKQNPEIYYPFAQPKIQHHNLVRKLSVNQIPTNTKQPPYNQIIPINNTISYPIHKMNSFSQNNRQVVYSPDRYNKSPSPHSVTPERQIIHNIRNNYQAAQK